MVVGFSTLLRPVRLACGVLALTLACGSRTGLLAWDDGTAGGGNGDDGGSDSSLPAGTLPPRPIAPLSTSRVTRRQPTLRWALPTGIPDVTVDICSDRACMHPLGTPVHVTGTSYAPTTPLPVGVVYWRLHPSTDTSIASATWEIEVGAGDAPLDTSWGTTLDVNGDGYADVVVGAPRASSIQGMAYVYLGGTSGVGTTAAATLSDPSSRDELYGGAVFGATN
jgi:hypothetical protein